MNIETKISELLDDVRELQIVVSYLVGHVLTLRNKQEAEDHKLDYLKAHVFYPKQSKEK